MSTSWVVENPEWYERLIRPRRRTYYQIIIFILIRKTIIHCYRGRGKKFVQFDEGYVDADISSDAHIRRITAIMLCHVFTSSAVVCVFRSIVYAISHAWLVVSKWIRRDFVTNDRIFYTQSRRRGKKLILDVFRETKIDR